eukprot:12287181-Heterocapsa_arctica.AAC.1
MRQSGHAAPHHPRALAPQLALQRGSHLRPDKLRGDRPHPARPPSRPKDQERRLRRKRVREPLGAMVPHRQPHRHRQPHPHDPGVRPAGERPYSGRHRRRTPEVQLPPDRSAGLPIS